MLGEPWGCWGAAVPSVPSVWRDACCCLLASEASCCSPRAVCAPGEPLAQPQLHGPRSQTWCWAVFGHLGAGEASIYGALLAAA